MYILQISMAGTHALNRKKKGKYITKIKVEIANIPPYFLLPA